MLHALAVGFALPFVVAMVAQLAGWLPAVEDWDSGTHGPWRHGPMRHVFGGLLVLLPWMGVTCSGALLWQWIETRSRRTAVVALAILLTAGVSWLVQLHYLYWITD